MHCGTGGARRPGCGDLTGRAGRGAWRGHPHRGPHSSRSPFCPCSVSTPVKQRRPRRNPSRVWRRVHHFKWQFRNSVPCNSSDENENLCESSLFLPQYPNPGLPCRSPQLGAAEQSRRPISVVPCQLPQASTGDPQATAPRWLQGWGAGPQVLQLPPLPQSCRWAWGLRAGRPRA